MQISIAIGAFLLLQSLDSGLYYSYIVGLRCLKGLGLKEARKEALGFQKKWINRHLKILLMALIEFQKAQCFFILPVQAAALAALSGRTSILTPVNELQDAIDRYLFSLIAISGMLPVVLILFALHGAGQKSWYVLGTSAIAVALSTTALLISKRIPKYESLDYEQYSACGYQNPSGLCPSKLLYTPVKPKASNYLESEISIATLSLVVLAIITLDFLWNPEQPIFVPIRDRLIRYIDQQKLKHAMLPGRAKSTPISSTKLGRFRLKLGRTWAKGFVQMFYSLTYFVISGYLMASLGMFFANWLSLFNSHIIIGTHTWGFGQIVAVAIWAAPICEWIYLEFRTYPHNCMEADG